MDIEIKKSSIIVKFEKREYAAVLIMTLFLAKNLNSWPDSIKLLNPNIEIRARKLLDNEFEGVFNILTELLAGKVIEVENSEDDNLYISELKFYIISEKHHDDYFFNK